MVKHNVGLFKNLKKSNVESFKYIFNAYYEQLYYYCLKFVCQKEIAEDLVQEVFITIWEKRKELEIKISLKSYLYAAVKNKAISYLRTKLVENQRKSIVEDENSFHYPISFEDGLEYSELGAILQKAIDLLPEQCRLIFNLSRNSGLTYKQIAQELGISPESVKTHISIALKKIKLHLAKYWENSLV